MRRQILAALLATCALAAQPKAGDSSISGKTTCFA
jgi:hypothetical protein